MPPSRAWPAGDSRNGGMITVVEEPVRTGHGRASGAPNCCSANCPSQRRSKHRRQAVAARSSLDIVRIHALRHALAGAVTATGAMRLAELRTTAASPTPGAFCSAMSMAGLPVSTRHLRSECGRACGA